MTKATYSEAALAHDLRIAVMRVTRRLRGLAGQRAVSLTQLSALSTIKGAGELTLGELAAREQVQPPSMTRVVTALVDAGYVVRNVPSDDRRQVLVSLTDDGRALLESDARQREAWLAQRLNTLTDDERANLRAAGDLLLKLVADNDSTSDSSPDVSADEAPRAPRATTVDVS